MSTSSIRISMHELEYSLTSHDLVGDRGAAFSIVLVEIRSMLLCLVKGLKCHFLASFLGYGRML